MGHCSPWSVVVLGNSRPFLLPAHTHASDKVSIGTCAQPRSSKRGHQQCGSAPTVRRPTSRVPAIEVFSTGMWSAKSASNTLFPPTQNQCHPHENTLSTRFQPCHCSHLLQLCVKRVWLVETAQPQRIPIEVFRAAKRRQAVCVRELCKHANLVAVLELAAAGHQDSGRQMQRPWSMRNGRCAQVCAEAAPSGQLLMRASL